MHDAWLLAASPRACLLPVACSLTACCLARSVALALGLCGSGLFFVFCAVYTLHVTVTGCRMQDAGRIVSLLIAYCFTSTSQQPATSHQSTSHQPATRHQPGRRLPTGTGTGQPARKQAAGSRQPGQLAVCNLFAVCCLTVCKLASSCS